jgi:carbonic anhydrase
MESYKRLLDFNARWAAERVAEAPDFFTRLAEEQQPEYLWIGCSDARVPAETITGCPPGDLFVHRNVANMVIHTDLNMSAVLHFAIDQLRVDHVIVCGHYGCGGVKAAMTRRSYGGVVNKWLRRLKEVYAQHAPSLESIRDEGMRARRLVELNVVQQVRDLAKAHVVQTAWRREGRPWLHGWVYDMETGKLSELTLLRPGDLEDDVFTYEPDDQDE